MSRIALTFLRIEKLLTVCSTPARISRIDLCLSVVGGASLVRRDANAKPPCFIDNSDSPVTVNTLDYYLAGIKNAINVLKVKTESLKQSMAATYCIQLSSNEMERAGFMDLSSLNADTDKQTFLQDFCDNTPSFLNQMRAHYDMLNELTNYFEELRMTSINDNPQEFQHNIYDAMCPIKIALHSQNKDPEVTVPSGELSEIFVLYRRGPFRVCKQQTSEYISMLDSRRIVTYLETVYRTLNVTSANCV